MRVTAHLRTAAMEPGPSGQEDLPGRAQYCSDRRAPQWSLALQARKTGDVVTIRARPAVPQWSLALQARKTFTNLVYDTEPGRPQWSLALQARKTMSCGAVMLAPSLDRSWRSERRVLQIGRSAF